MRRVLTILGVAAILSLTQQAVFAVVWGPVTSTYNGSVVVSGTGDFYNYGNVYAKNKMVVVDTKDDGDAVYGCTTFYYWEPDGFGTYRWIVDSTKSTPEHQNATKTYYLSDNLHALATSARGASKVCAQLGFPVPDSCSPSAYPSFSY